MYQVDVKERSVLRAHPPVRVRKRRVRAFPASQTDREPTTPRVQCKFQPSPVNTGGLRCSRFLVEHVRTVVPSRRKLCPSASSPSRHRPLLLQRPRGLGLRCIIRGRPFTKKRPRTDSLPDDRRIVRTQRLSRNGRHPSGSPRPNRLSSRRKDAPLQRANSTHTLHRQHDTGPFLSPQLDPLLNNTPDPCASE